MDFYSFMTQSELLLRIVVACICGCIIGYERESRNKGAGIRTHAIVSLAAALIMIVSKYGFRISQTITLPVLRPRLSAVSAFWERELYL